MCRRRLLDKCAESADSVDGQDRAEDDDARRHDQELEDVSICDSPHAADNDVRQYDYAADQHGYLCGPAEHDVHDGTYRNDLYNADHEHVYHHDHRAEHTCLGAVEYAETFRRRQDSHIRKLRSEEEAQQENAQCADSAQPDGADTGVIGQCGTAHGQRSADNAGSHRRRESPDADASAGDHEVFCSLCLFRYPDTNTDQYDHVTDHDDCVDRCELSHDVFSFA